MSLRIDQIPTTRVLPKATDYAEVGNAIPESAKMLFANMPQRVAILADLKALVIAAAVDGFPVLVQGGAAIGDGAGGLFSYSAASVLADDGANVLTPNVGAGRWLRQNDKDRVAVADTVAALKALAVSLYASGEAILLRGYYAAGDGGGGLFRYDSASAVADNGGTVIAPTLGAGRWVRLVTDAINVRQFGAKADGATDDGAAFRAAILYLGLLGGGTLKALPGSTYKISTAVPICDGVLLDLQGSAIVGPGIGSATDLFQSGYLNAGVLTANVALAPGTQYLKHAGIRNGRISNCGKALNILNAIDNCEFTNLYFLDCERAVYVVASFYSIFFNLFSRGTAAASALSAYYFANAVNVENIQSMFVTDRSLGFEIGAGGAYGLKFLNCSAEQGGTGVKINGSTGPVEFDTCYFEGLTGDAITLNNAGPKLYTRVHNCFFNTITGAGVRGGPDGTQLLIDYNNQFLACGTNVINNDNFFAYGQIEIPTAVVADNGVPTLPAGWSLGDKSRIFHEYQAQDSVSGLCLAKTKVHGTNKIAFEHEGDGGAVTAGVAFNAVSFTGIVTAINVRVDGKIVYNKYGANLMFRFTVADNLGTYEIYGFIFGDTVKQLDATGKTVAVSNNGGFVRLTLASFNHPSGAVGISGTVRHI